MRQNGEAFDSGDANFVVMHTVLREPDFARPRVAGLSD